jgi:aryl-alcohol dehydrogenase-like predicted oxidoreductase
MEYRKLGDSDLRVSALGLGCATFGREIDEAASFAMIDRALDSDINLLDTAEAYGRGVSEEVLGNYFRKTNRRDRFVLATKKLPALGYRAVIEGLEASLRRLRTECVDLYQLHAFDPQTPLDETFRALDQLVSEGKVRTIGCSNFSAGNLADAIETGRRTAGARLVSLQPNYNLAVREIEKEILPVCAREGLGVISYSPLGAGFLTGKFRRGGEIPPGTRFDIMPGHQDIYLKDRLFDVVEGLERIARETDYPMIQLALRWLMTRSGITSILIGGRRVEHIDQAIRALEREDIPSEVIDRLSHLSQWQATREEPP